MRYHSTTLVLLTCVLIASGCSSETEIQDADAPAFYNKSDAISFANRYSESEDLSDEERRWGRLNTQLKMENYGVRTVELEEATRLDELECVSGEQVCWYEVLDGVHQGKRVYMYSPFAK